MARWDPWRGCHRYSEGCRFAISIKVIRNVELTQTK